MASIRQQAKRVGHRIPCNYNNRVQTRWIGRISWIVTRVSIQIDPAIGTPAVKFAVDTGIFLVSLLSIALRHPFTLQYALEEVDAETARLPDFLYANYLITWAWTGAALLMMIGNILLLYIPSLPLWSGLLIAFAARNSAVYFTKWYPQYRKAKYGTAPVNALPVTR